MAQLHGSYILCQDPNGLVVVDQHAAHERVLYERSCRALENGSLKSQRLLLPQKLMLGPSQAERIQRWQEALNSLGLELQDLGGGAFYLLSIPAFMKNVQIPPLIQDLLDEVGEELEKDPLGALRRELAAMIACKAAIKAGDALNLEEMQRLMSDLSRCEIPWSCPHGRPPFVRLTLEELEKHFERR
jgi:DNA mismatch repair protein MutL